MAFDLSKTPKSIIQASKENPHLRIVAVDGETPELMIMDDIGQGLFTEGVRSADVAGFLSQYKDREVHARVNSYGGDAFEGLVMFNAFQEHGNVTATVEGISFSAASIATSGARVVRMQPQSEFGIHRAWTGVMGNQKALMSALDWLVKVDEHQLDIFSKRTGKSRGQIADWLDGTDDGTLWNAVEALDKGFADEIVGSSEKPKKAAASKRIAAMMRHKRALMSART